MTLVRLASAMLALLVGVFGCRPERVGEAVREMSGEAYLRRIETPHHRVEVRYLPRALRRLQESGLPDSTRLTPRLEKSLRFVEGGSSLVFVIRLAPLDEKAQPDFVNDLVYGKSSGYTTAAEAQRAFAFEMKERIWIESDGIKVPAAHYQMENSYGIAPGRTFLVAFPEIRADYKKIKKIQLVLDDVVPGMARRKITWKLPVGNYDDAI